MTRHRATRLVRPGSMQTYSSNVYVCMGCAVLRPIPTIAPHDSMGGRQVMSIERKVFVATLASLGMVAFGGSRASAAPQDAAATQNTSNSQASPDAKAVKNRTGK